MDPITPASIPLPPVLDPILTFLSSTLPPPLYSLIFNSLANSIALFSSLLTLFTTLLSTKPWEWDTQTIIPPIIMFLTAWLALVSLWRTTSWMFRVGTWFAKWGIIVGAVVAFIGWIVGDPNTGVVGSLGGMVLDFINGPGRNAAGQSRTRTRTRTRPKRPNVWDSFEVHRAWQYSENEQGAGSVDVRKIVGDVVDKVRDGTWWKALTGSESERDRNKRKSGRKAKTKAKTKGKTSKVR